MNNITIPEIASLLNGSDSIIIISHTSPDGDTIGAATALGIALKLTGKKVTLLCDSDIPEYLKFVCGDLYTKDTDCDGLIVSVDVASVQMLGKLADKYSDRVDIRIDHHETGDDFARFNYCVSNAAAACEIIYDLLSEMKIMNGEIASALYTGISTDTGSFKYSSTTSKTLRIAADLIDCGAESEDINEHLYENLSIASLRADSLFLKKMETYLDGRLLIVPITISDKIDAEIDDEQLEGFSALARKLNGVELGISLREKEPCTYKVSMRSRRSVDCASICAAFGGGGHVRAAGATIKAENIDKAKSILLNTVLEKLKNNFDYEGENGENQ
jgi:bifunctional oligoribonuclease and PAP phosphatase NrnA